MAKNLTRFPGDVTVPGHLTVGSIDLPSASIGDDKWDPADPLSSGNQQQRYALRHSQKHGTAVVTERMPIHVGVGDNGIVIAIHAALVVPCTGDANVTVNLYKNGVSILSSIITIDVDQAAFESVEGTLDDGEDDFDIGDVLEVVITATAGTGALGQGLIVTVIVDEDPA